MSEAVIRRRLREITRVYGSTIIMFTPEGKWVKCNALMPGVKPRTRAARDGLDTFLREEAAKAAVEWSEQRLRDLQDAADLLSGNYGPQRRSWIAKLLKARLKRTGGEE